jgi:hypothetical protein
MVTDVQVRRLRRLDLDGWSKEQAAAKVGIDSKTARKYRRLGQLPSEIQQPVELSPSFARLIQRA